MTLSMYQASVPAFTQTLNALAALIDKAETHCAQRKIDPAALTGARLFPDMFAFARQIQIATDFAKGCTSRLAGIAVPSWEDNETTFAELKARLAKTVDFISSVKPAAFEGSDDRAIELKIAGNPVKFDGQTYLALFALPNFYFHAATAYAILRTNGVEVAKRDFLGAMPGLTV